MSDHVHDYRPIQQGAAEQCRCGEYRAMTPDTTRTEQPLTDEPPPLSEPLRRAAWFYARHPNTHSLIRLRAELGDHNAQAEAQTAAAVEALRPYFYGTVTNEDRERAKAVLERLLATTPEGK